MSTTLRRHDPAGNSFAVAFAFAADAVIAAVDAQRSLRSFAWDGVEIGVRIGVHIGAPTSAMARTSVERSAWRPECAISPADASTRAAG